MTEQMTEPQVKEIETQHKNLALLVYLLQALGFVTGGLTCIAGLVVNYLKMSAMRDTWLESHFRWQLNTFWYGLLWSLLGWRWGRTHSHIRVGNDQVRYAVPCLLKVNLSVPEAPRLFLPLVSETAFE